jgi:hypothetical protein
VPEPELEIDQLCLLPETDADCETLRKLINEFEISGCGILPSGVPLHVCLKLERKPKNVLEDEPVDFYLPPGWDIDPDEYLNGL